MIIEPSKLVTNRDQVLTESNNFTIIPKALSSKNVQTENQKLQSTISQKEEEFTMEIQNDRDDFTEAEVQMSTDA